jgi:hypothetical protein
MLNLKEFPVVLSPNLGCPELVSVDDVKIPLIFATQPDQFIQPSSAMLIGTLSLRSCNGTQVKIPLKPSGPVTEIADWNRLTDFREVRATREILNSELHYNVLGEGTRYYRVDVIPEKGHDNLLAGIDGEPKATSRLFDLVLRDSPGNWERVNHHAVQIMENVKGGLKFIHLTDLHIARRNDEMLAEIVKDKTTEQRGRIEGRFVNYNDKFREFIVKANKLAGKGELDFVVITGDLVDFAYHGWESEVNWDENNWKCFVDIVTGRGKEGERKKPNPGIQIAIFTSTGNHDWRLYPYDPKSYSKSLGVDACDLKNFDYKSFDSSEYVGSGQVRVSRALGRRSWARLNMAALGLRGFLSSTGKTLAPLAVSKALPAILLTLSGAGIVGPAVVHYFTRQPGESAVGWPDSPYWYFSPLLGVLVFMSRKSLQAGACWLADRIISLLGSLHADATALHYYFAYINPYLDYAFQIGDHNFIVMDTGADIFTGNLDRKSWRSIKNMSVEDNVLAMSPDSRAFDTGQEYYNWSQIVWLEKLLSTLRENKSKGRTFVFLHAPPLNLPKKFPNLDLGWLQPAWNRVGRILRKRNKVFRRRGGIFFRRSSLRSLWIGEIDQNELREEVRVDCGKTRYIPYNECDLTFGTTKNYLSEFLHLCLGYREGDLSSPKGHGFFCRIRTFLRLLLGVVNSNGKKTEQNTPRVTPTVKSVDLVFSGHAHRNIEFRIEMDKNHRILAYSDWYSLGWPRKQLRIPPRRRGSVIVQTAACGLYGGQANKPPYFRRITIGARGRIESFRLWNLKGQVKLPSSASG